MKRITVEVCSKLSIFELRQEGALSSDERDNYLHGNGVEIPLTRTRCYFGGFRWWFICTNCGRRVGILYKPRRVDQFLCRHCHDLTYTICQERRTCIEALWRSFRIADRYKRICDGKGRKGYSKIEILQMVKLMGRVNRLPVEFQKMLRGQK